MLTIDEARTIADRWRDQFVLPESFDLSWTRFFDMVGDPTAEKLERWLAKDQAKDAVKHAGIVTEPLLPVRQRYTPGDESSCNVCKGLRYVRRDVSIDHLDFGKAWPCPVCGGR